MDHLFLRDRSKQAHGPQIVERGSLAWCYEVPAYKMLHWPHYMAAVILFVTILVIYYSISYDFFFQSDWALLMLPLAGVAAGAIILALLPNKQVFYNIDKEGVTAELHMSCSPTVSVMKLFLGIVASWLGDLDFFSSRHFSATRSISWSDVRKIDANEQWCLVTLKGALKGTIRVWTTEDNFQNVYSLIRGYSSENARRFVSR